MKINNKWLMLALTLTFSAVFLVATGDVGAVYTAIDGGYVGSAACGDCHTAKYNDFMKSGHPYKVRMTNGLTPVSGTPVAGQIQDPLSALLSSNMPLLAGLNTDADVTPANDGTGHLAWSSIDYVIGGFGWKARWGIKDTDSVGAYKTGYVWSSASTASGTSAQFNMLAADATLDPKSHRGNWSTYGSATLQTKKYSCAICHNTNGTSSVDALCTTALNSGRTQPWLDSDATVGTPGGYASEWTYSGVQCEACHGPGETHANNAVLPSTNPNPIGQLTLTFGSNTYEICAKCHIRTNNNSLGYGAECGGDSNEAHLTGGSTTATSGFEGHHQQFNQVAGYNGDGAHASLKCTDCHDPHKRAATVQSGIATALGITDNNQSAEARGAVVSCESCHATGTPLAAAGGADTKVSGLGYDMGAIKCIDCHMASSTQSATSEKATGTTLGIAAWGKEGDVAGHIFKIDPTQTVVSRTNAAGKLIAQNYISVDYACGKCHDPYMNTYVGRPLTQGQAQASAVNIHTGPIPPPAIPVPPTAKFKLVVSQTTDRRVDLDATPSVKADSYNWSFTGAGTCNPVDGTTLTSAVLKCDFTVKGVYTATLTVTNTSSGLTNTRVSPVYAIEKNVAPTATIGSSVNTTTNEATLTLTGGSADIVKVFIDWNDGSGTNDTDGTYGPYTHTYGSEATYYASVTLVDNLGLRTTYKVALTTK